MASGIRFIACVVACLAMSGCASNDLIIKRQTEAEAKLDYLTQADKKNGLRLNELAGQLQALDDQAKASSAQLIQQQDTIRELRKAQDELKARLVLLAQQTATPKVEVVNQESSPANRNSGPPNDYLKAFGLYSANNFSAAIEAFESFLKNNPQSEYSANATYWIGECHYSQSNLPLALTSFQKAVDNYPKSSKAPDALLKLGYTQAAMHDTDKATATFERLIKAYPGSHAAARARERLTAH